MKAVVITTSGDPQVLQVQEVENPEIGDDEVLIRVDAAAINRADTLQRKGLHPSSKAAVPARASNVLESSKLLEKPSFDGRLAISWASSSCPIWCFSEGCCWNSRGCMSCLVNCFNDEPTVCRRNIPDVCINYKTVDFVAWVKEEPGGKGFQGGTVAEVNLSGLLARCLTVQAAGLQNRSLENKAVIVSEVENVWPTVTGVQVFSIDGSSRGSPAHGKQQAYWEDTAHFIMLWL